MKINELEPVYLCTMPDIYEEGKLYISFTYNIAGHLCACGCGGKTITPLTESGWKFSELDGRVTLRPSIGNFSGENPYHAHYFITMNRIDWL